MDLSGRSVQVQLGEAVDLLDEAFLTGVHYPMAMCTPTAGAHIAPKWMITL